MIKKTIILILLFISGIIYSQDKKKFFIEYVSFNSLSISKNMESHFSKFNNDSDRNKNGFGFDLNTIHGARFFGYISISAGLSIDYNVNKSFLSTPYIVDLRLYSNKTLDNCLFIYLQTGQNIKWSDSFNGKGTSSKLGVGGIIEYSDKISYFIDVFKKSKEIELYQDLEKGNYSITGYGISIGIVF